MKIYELVAVLLNQDQNAEVVIPGYEIGVFDVRQVVPAVIFKNENRPYWCGRYSLNEPDAEFTPKGAEPIVAVYLPLLDHEDSSDAWYKKWILNRIKNESKRVDHIITNI